MSRTLYRWEWLGIVVIFLGPIVAAGQDRRYDYDQVVNCERTLHYETTVLQEGLKQAKLGETLIIIVRLGDGENSRTLIRRRLTRVREFFLKGGFEKTPEHLVVAEGEKVKGYGRLEYYLSGRLFERLLISKNGNICDSCCGSATTD
jgi:hypothetical protein